ncbi:MAG TPA: hypothetical protein VMD47_07255 [Candidatus Acidoferrales bacterium]|nr:hypothetical protein [Candidatus Acidoferrales bacterium]
MIITVRLVAVMEMPCDEIVGMPRMWNHFVPASGIVLMARIMTVASVRRRATTGVGVRNVDGVLVDVIAVDEMQMAIVKIVDMVRMANFCMRAVGAMHVTMLSMSLVIHTCSIHPAGALRNSGDKVRRRRRIQEVLCRSIPDRT